MRCQNCGKNEVNFHYTSNINGTITETHLCSECAEKSGYDYGTMFGGGFARSLMNEFLAIPGARGFINAPGLFMPYPFGAWPQMGILTQGTPSCTHCAPSRTANGPEIDEDMKKRREINQMREEMHLAAKNEDYEKAAELRDKLRQLEG